ncbi:hypothetical protein TrVFT333_002721 [Trichoderma virens FT-333]|nr:hypothetical protein TrVFT333_002721 [Trichoderma virens FT-333]
MIRQRATSDLEDSETRHKERVASDLGNAEANVDKSSTNEMVDADIETEMKQTGEKALVDIEIGNYRTDEKAQSAKKTPTKGNVPSTLAKGSQQCKEEIEVQVGDARQKLPPGLSKRLALAGLQTMAELKAELKAELEAELKAEVMAELEDKVVAAVVTKLEPQHKITEEHMGKASRFMEKNRERSAKE